MRRVRRLVRSGGVVALIATLLTVTGIVGFAPSAATASTVCGAPFSHPRVAYMANHSFNVTNVQYCPIWKANTPVYDEACTSCVETVVGYLTYAGSSNWFVCHDSSYKATYSAYGYSTNDWAITQADNGNWGWVPAVYFSGAENYWNGLRACTTYEDP